MQWDPPWLGANQQTLVARLLLSHQRAFPNVTDRCSPTESIPALELPGIVCLRVPCTGP
jgi:hypothetical protein